MIITKIEKQKNNNKMYSIFLNNEFAFSIDEVNLIYFKLKENEILTEEKYTKILDNILLKKAKDTALKYLSYKMRTEKQIKEKLISKEFPESIINKVINILKKYNYINDDIFAKYFIKDKINIKGYGLFKIKYELKSLGICEKIYNKYLKDEIFLAEEKKAIELIQKKMKKIDILNYKEKEKLYSYLLRRGFSFDTINKALNTFLEEYYG